VDEDNGALAAFDCGALDADGDATLFAVAGDFATTGIATSIGVPSLEVTENVTAGVAASDPIVRQGRDRLFIINRFGADNVTILEKGTHALLDQISTGANSNPQDVVERGDLLYVAALGAPGVLVLDSTMPGAGVISTIDLSGVRLSADAPPLDPDGNPNCSTLALLGDNLFVACGLLDDGDPFLSPRGPGAVVVINLADAGAERRVFLLPHARPFGLLQPHGSDLVVATVPSFADSTMGCLARIFADGSGAECLAENAALGGFAASYRSCSTEDLVVSVTAGFDENDFGPFGSVVQVGDGTVSMALTSVDERPFDLARCPTGHIVVSQVQQGVRVFEPGGEQLTSSPLEIGIAPVQNGLVCY